jgi:hypothetical protein
MLYEEVGSGLVRVTTESQTGVYRCTGEWVEGDLLEPALHMLVWVGAPNLPVEHQGSVRAKALKRLQAARGSDSCQGARLQSPED